MRTTLFHAFERMATVNHKRAHAYGDARRPVKRIRMNNTCVGARIGFDPITDWHSFCQKWMDVCADGPARVAFLADLASVFAFVGDHHCAVRIPDRKFVSQHVFEQRLLRARRLVYPRLRDAFGKHVSWVVWLSCLTDGERATIPSYARMVLDPLDTLASGLAAHLTRNAVTVVLSYVASESRRGRHLNIWQENIRMPVSPNTLTAFDMRMLHSADAKVVTRHLRWIGRLHQWWRIRGFLIDQFHVNKGWATGKTKRQYDFTDADTSRAYTALYCGRKGITSSDVFPCAVKSTLEVKMMQEVTDARSIGFDVHYNHESKPRCLRFDDFCEVDWRLDACDSMTQHDRQVLARFSTGFLAMVDQMHHLISEMHRAHPPFIAECKRMHRYLDPLARFADA